MHNNLKVSYLKIVFLLSFLTFDLSPFHAQINNPLEGLKIAGPGDIPAGTPLMLDPMSMPMYDEKLQKIEPSDFMTFMMSNEYIPEPYIDSKKNIKAFVLRKATSEEKTMIENMQLGGMGMKQEKSVMIGNPANDFNVNDLKGKNHTLSALKGKVIVLNFWFIECKPCIMEMPDLNTLVEENNGKDVVFIALALNPKKAIKKFLKKTEFNFRVVADGQTTADSYGVKSFPTNVIIDQNGIIQYVSVGVGPNNKENLQKTIKELLIE